MEGVPLEASVRDSLLRTLFGTSNPDDLPLSWIGQSFSFHNGRSVTFFALVQLAGGPCGVLASIQVRRVKSINTSLRACFIGIIHLYLLVCIIRAFNSKWINLLSMRHPSIRFHMHFLLNVETLYNWTKYFQCQMNWTFNSLLEHSAGCSKVRTARSDSAGCIRLHLNEHAHSI